MSARTRAVLAAGVLLGSLAVSARAQWTDGAAAVATFSTGSIDLRLGSDSLDDDPEETTSLELTDMVPGSAVSAALPISSVGSVPLTYSMRASTTGVLAAGLLLDVFAGAACTGTPTVLAQAPLDGAAFAGRPLGAAGTSEAAETLCLRVSLPASAATGLQGETASATFTFTAVSV